MTILAPAVLTLTLLLAVAVLSALTWAIAAALGAFVWGTGSALYASGRSLARSVSPHSQKREGGRRNRRAARP